MIARAQREGAFLATGGHRLQDHLAGGYFIAPTLFTNVDPSSELFQQEVFGPVVSIWSFGSEDEAIEVANNSVSGSVNYVHTTSLVRHTP